ncbi:MAG: tetratricopeptide repeat protein [Bacteroidota bacterium]
MKIKKLFFAFISVLLIGIDATRAQNAKIDSLQRLLESSSSSEIQDTTEIKIHNTLCWEYRTTGEMEKALDHGNIALQLAEKNVGSSLGAIAGAAKKGMAASYNNIGIIYDIQSNYPKALKYYFNSLKIREEIKDKKGIANSFNNVGFIYGNQSDYPKALEYFFKSLEIWQEIGNKKGFAMSYGNIGIIYKQQSNYPKAMEYHSQSLKIKKEIGDKIGIAQSYSNIGSLYAALADQPDSIKQAFMAPKYTNGQKERSIAALNEILLDSALSFQTKAFRITEELNDKYSMAYSLMGIGEALQKKRKYAQAVTFYRLAVSLADSINTKEQSKDAAQGLYFCYKKLNKYDSALYWHEKAAMLKDSIFSSEKQKDLGRQEANFEYEKQQALDQAAHEKELALSTEQQKQQRLISYSAGGGLAIVLLFSVVIANRLRVTRRQKGIIEKQQTEVSNAYAILHEKNKNITDSINYAKRIQQALLKEEEHVSEHLPEHFILFKPKDIVSGDFYWSYEKEIKEKKGKTKYWYLAAVDCTGHGVPGAFMSMLGVAFLNEINSTDQLLSPAEILDRLRNKILKELSQTGKEGESKDGMDISLVRINLSTHEMQWSGANNPLWLFSQEKFTEMKPDKQPIGFHHEQKPFTNYKLQLKKDDGFYLFTDGYADQFGGDKGKKFKYKQLQELLLANYEKPMNEQKIILDNTIEKWKGNLEQVDDILIIGVRV